MASRQADPSPADDGAIRLHFVVAVWGAEYCRLFLEIGLPSLLSPGNLPGLGGNVEPRFEIYTRAEDIPLFDEAACVGRLRALMPVDFVSVELAGQAPHALMSDCHREGLRNAARRGAAVVFIPPDCVWADGSFANLARIAARRPPVVHMSGLRLDRDAVAPKLRKGWGSDGGAVLSIPPRDLVRLGMDHLHPITDDLFFRERSDKLMPANLLWTVPGQGVLARCFHLHPLLAAADERGAAFTTTIDDDLALVLDPDGASDYVVTDTDEILAFELSGLDHRVQAAFEKGSVEDVAAWAEVAANARHRQLVRTPIRIHWTDIDPAKWRAAEEEAEELVDRVAALNARSGWSLMWHHAKILQYRGYAASLRAPQTAAAQTAEPRASGRADSSAWSETQSAAATHLWLADRLDSLPAPLADRSFAAFRLALPSLRREQRRRRYDGGSGGARPAAPMTPLATELGRRRRGGGTRRSAEATEGPRPPRLPRGGGPSAGRILARAARECAARVRLVLGDLAAIGSDLAGLSTRLRRLGFRTYETLHGWCSTAMFGLRTAPMRLRYHGFLIFQRGHGAVSGFRHLAVSAPARLRRRRFLVYEAAHGLRSRARHLLSAFPARLRTRRFLVYQAAHGLRSRMRYLASAFPARLRARRFLAYQAAHGLRSRMRYLASAFPARLRARRFLAYQAAHGLRSRARHLASAFPARLRARRFLVYQAAHGLRSRMRAFAVSTPARLRHRHFLLYQNVHGRYLRAVFEMRTFPARLRVARFLAYQRLYGWSHRLHYEIKRIPTRAEQRFAYWASLISGGLRYHGFTAYQRCHHAVIVARFRLVSAPARWRVARFRVHERLHHWRNLAAFRLRSLPGWARYHGFLLYQRAHHIHVQARWRVVSAPFHLRVVAQSLLRATHRAYGWMFGAPPQVRPWHWRSAYERQVVRPLIEEIAARPGRVLLVETADMPIGAAVHARRVAAGLPDIALWHEAELPERLAGRFDAVVVRRRATRDGVWPLLPRVAALVRPGGALMVSVAHGSPAAIDDVAAALGGRFHLAESHGRGGPGTALLLRLYRRARGSAAFGHRVSPWLELAVRAACAPLFVVLSPAAALAASLVNLLGARDGPPVETVFVLHRLVARESAAPRDARTGPWRRAGGRRGGTASALQRRKSG